MKISNDKLDNLIGGNATFNTAMARVIIDLIKLIGAAGEGLGSSIRRISEGSICPTR